MAPSNTPDGQPYPARRSVNGDGLETIGTTGRLEPAPRPQQRADECAVEPDEREQHAGDQPFREPVGLPGRLGRGRMLRCHDRPSVGVRASDPRRRSRRLSATSSSAARCSLRADAAGGLARTTKRLPLGSIGRRLRMRCLNLRLTWFRTTAPPTALLTTKPTSGGSSASRRFRCATRTGRPARRPRRIASANSSPRRMRDADGSTGPSSTYGRPLHRRREGRRARAGGDWSSDRQLGAALAAARGQDGAAGPGAHAQPEAVGLRAATVVRLVSTLAHEWAPGFRYARGLRTRHNPMSRGLSYARACEIAVA